MNAKYNKSRLLFLDNLKILFAILVVFTHIRVAYGGEGWWYYISSLNENNPIDEITLIIFYMTAGIGGIFQPALMGLFFLMASYFIPKSYDRKGNYKFWKERLLRIGIPLLLYILLFNPVISYLLAVGGIQPWASYSRMQGSFIEYYLSNFFSIENFIEFITFWTITWFLAVLLIFTTIYTLWRQLSKINMIKIHIPKELAIPKNIYLFLISIGLGFLTFLVRINFPFTETPLGLPIGYMIQYFMMFCFGIIAYRYAWFEQMTKKHIKVWAITIFIAVMLFFTYFFVIVGVDSDFSTFFGGFNFNAFVFALVDNICSMGMIFVLIKIFQAKFNKQGKILKNLADSSYYIYLLHPFVAIPLSLSIASIQISPIIKLTIVFPLTFILCYLLSHYIIENIHLTKKKRVENNQ
jgi:fucose 4-O-acetylase-like acetyltransferase